MKCLRVLTVARFDSPKVIIVMRLGTVKWFNESKGFGFITPQDGGEDVFVHYSCIKGGGFRTLAEGQAVKFDAQKGPKGMQATAVEPAD